MQVNKALYRAEQVRQLDRCAIETHGVAALVLMKRAGRAAFEALSSHWPDAKQLQVFCGAGNNAGDAYVVAALATQKGFAVTVWELAEKLSPDAALAKVYAQQEGVDIKPFDVAAYKQAQISFTANTVIVDGLLGTGTHGALRDHYVEAISRINDSRPSICGVLALDIPSGIHPDTGAVASVAVYADLTVSFIGQKLGNVIGKGRVHSGRRKLSTLSIPAAVYSDAQQDPVASCLDAEVLRPLIKPRALDAHKGDSGHVLVVGGDEGYGGAALMAAQMAVRSGAGLVGLATQAANVSAAIARQPELMAVGVSSGQSFLPLLEKPTVLVVGPGLGQSCWSEQLLYHCVRANKPMVVDADALNILSQGRLSLSDCPSPSNRQWVLSPHPGEAARLLETSIAEIEKDRIAAINAIQARWGGTVILKGAGTLVLGADGVLSVCDAGNPGMASGGMGDVLSGLLGSLLAQGFSTDNAARLGVLLHAMAADSIAANQGQRGLLATDLIEPVRDFLNQE